MSIVTIEQLKSKFEGGDHPGSADYINLIDTLAALPEGGNVVLNGVGVPSSGTGANGDFYINTSNYDIYGPKTSGSWGSATSLVGPTGATGSTGSQGATGATGAAGTNGTNGATGDTGPAGPGVSSGGTTGQYLTKVDGTNYNTQWSTLDLSGKQDVVANVSSTEIGYLDGVTSAIQTQLNAKQAVVSGVNDTEIGYLDGVTSAIQTQLDAKTAKSTLSTTGDIYYASSANTPARLGIGSTGNVLTVASGIPSWAAPSSGGMTLLSTTAMSGASTTVSSIPSTYINLFVVVILSDPQDDGGGLLMRFNGDDTANRHARVIGGFGNGNVTFNQTSGQLTYSQDNGTPNGIIMIEIPFYSNSTIWKYFRSSGVVNSYLDQAKAEFTMTACAYNQSTAISALEFFFNGGVNTSGGTIYVYGVK